MPYPAYVLVKTLPDGGINALSGLRNCQNMPDGAAYVFAVDTVIACKLFYFPPYRIAGIPVTAPSGAVFSSLPPYFTLLP
ncbi:hypothetical protein, partial [Citrobacter rodentium]|uniref:hypothetical protein n=1 Tax=Citrobacter rodentium TaxID=67825 RepID=UPI001C3EBA1C